MNDKGSDLVYSSYLGGNSQDFGTGIEFAVGNIYVAGSTSSTNFRTTPGAYQEISQGGDAFVMKFALTQPNQAPAANADTYPVNEDTTLTVPARGVLANDTDPDNNSLTAALVTGRPREHWR